VRWLRLGTDRLGSRDVWGSSKGTVCRVASPREASKLPVGTQIFGDVKARGCNLDFPFNAFRTTDRLSNCRKRMPSSGMLRRAALLRTDVSEGLSTSFIRVTRIGELGTTLAVRLVISSQRASVASYS
jgi:hypothetical protein